MADQQTGKAETPPEATQKQINEAALKVVGALENFVPQVQSRILRAASVMLGIEQRPAQQQRPPQQQQRGNGGR